MLKEKLYTLVFVQSAQRILLGMKKRGFGKGRWNGFGGKVMADENIVDAAKRELHEECNIRCSSLQHVGILKFEFVNDPVVMNVHVFHTKHYEGDPEETEEMRPKWYDIANIPFSDMWPDDHLWLPIMLNGAKFEGYFKFQGMDNILEHTLKKVDTLNPVL